MRPSGGSGPPDPSILPHQYGPSPSVAPPPGYGWAGYRPPPPPPVAPNGAPLAAFAGTLLVYYVYRVELMFRTGQTVGKRVMKLRVVPLEPHVTPTRGIAARRWLVDSLAVQVVPLLLFLDGLWQLWDQPYRQCLHDKVAETTVVKVAS